MPSVPNFQSTENPHFQDKPRFAAKLPFIALAYFASGRLGLAIPYVGTHITLIWLPTGIAVGVFLRWGYGCWPGVFFGAAATNFSIDSSPLLDSSIALGNMLGPAWLLRRLKFHDVLGRTYDILFLGVAAAIVQTIIAMTQALGLNVIAEEVEAETQHDFLDKHGCHAFQGCLFGKLVPIGEFEALLGKP